MLKCSLYWGIILFFLQYTFLYKMPKEVVLKMYFKNLPK